MRRYAGISSGPRTEEWSASMMLSELKYDAYTRYSDLFSKIHIKCTFTVTAVLIYDGSGFVFL